MKSPQNYPIHSEKIIHDLQQSNADLKGQVQRLEQQILQKALSEADKYHYRQEYSKPIVTHFFNGCQEQRLHIDLVNSNPLSKALNYVTKRKAELNVYLDNAAVPIDTNHLERALRVIPMGRENWLFCWTEIGAEHVAIIQSLLVTCKLHDVNFYDYLVDVLQRIDHQAIELTLREWKQRFAKKPMRSDIARRSHD